MVLLERDVIGLIFCMSMFVTKMMGYSHILFSEFFSRTSWEDLLHRFRFYIQWEGFHQIPNLPAHKLGDEHGLQLHGYATAEPISESWRQT